MDTLLFQRSSFNPPKLIKHPSAFRVSRSHCNLSRKPIATIVKEHTGRERYGTNISEWTLSPNSYIPIQWRKKFLCQWSRDRWVRDGTFPESEEDKREVNKELPESGGGLGGKPCPKIFMVLAGASICVATEAYAFTRSKIFMGLAGTVFFVVLGVCAFTVSKQEALPQMVVPCSGEVLDQDVESQSESIGLSKEGGLMLQRRTRNMQNVMHQLISMFNDKVNSQLNLAKSSKKKSITFDDVQGVDDAKAELLEIVLCIKGDNKYVKLGGKVPKGVLLAGPPGTGKTLLARVVAAEAGVSFFPISGSELVEVYVGIGAARVRELFRKARKNSPAIIFIDEIDAVGGQRGSSMNSERDQTLNQLLTEMDGFDKDGSVVVVIAATNRPETLDSALMRAGRFSRKVVVREPDEEGRVKIFGLFLKDVPMEEHKEDICRLVAANTPGLVGADLESIAQDSVLLAARRDGDFVTKDDVLEAVKRALKGLK